MSEQTVSGVAMAFCHSKASRAYLGRSERLGLQSSSHAETIVENVVSMTSGHLD